MRKGSILLFLCIFAWFVPANYANAQTWNSEWNPQTSGTTNNLYSVYFTNTTHGLAVGDNGTILKTSNGGTSWNAITNPYTGTLKSVYCVDTNNCWACGGANSPDILKSTNGGSSWTNIAVSGSSGGFNGVQFLNQNYGYVVSDDGALYATYNGGATWTKTLFNNGNDPLYSISMTDTSVGIITAGNGKIYARDSSGWGTNPSPTYTVSGGENLFAAYCRNIDTAYACGMDGGLTATASGFSNFSEIFIYPLPTWYSVFFVDTNHGWLVGSAGTIVVTTNNISWNQQASATTNTLRAIYMTGISSGWTVGDKGTILKYSGASGIRENIPENLLLENFPNPFSGVTTIKFSLPESSNVKLEIYNTLGNKMETLVNATLAGGAHQIELNAWNYPKGIYFYKLVAGDFSATGKMIVAE